MKIEAIGGKKAKRATRMVIEAQNETEEAALYQHFLALREQPPALAAWYIDVLKCLEDGPKTPRQIADLLGIGVTACNNRVAHVYEIGLVIRTPNLDKNRTKKGFIYSLDQRGPGDEAPADILEL